jgi:outer membrane protein
MFFKQGLKQAAFVSLSMAFILVAAGESASAQTLEQSLVAAYGSNATLNTQRAATRASDENVPRALSGYRPTIEGSAGVARNSAGVITAATPTNPSITTNKVLNQSQLSITITQNLYNGFRTANNTRAAEAEVRQSREILRQTEQQVLLDAVTAHMNVLRDEALLQLQQQNLQALGSQLKAARDRFAVGEVTRTDTALAEAAEAGGRSSLIQAQSALESSRAVYRQVIGLDPRKLTPGRPVDPLLPHSFNEAVLEGVDRHPAVVAAQYAIDFAALQVKVAEGALLPSVNAQGILSRNNEPQIGIDRQTSASVGLNATAPVYQGGGEYAAVRQAKEVLGQTRIQMDVTREQVRAMIVQFWSQLQAAKSSIQAAQTQVNAQRIALNGITEEYKVGQRTITDVLNAQAQLVQAQSNLVNSQRDRVVASYAVLGAIGHLDASTLNLNVVTYDPQEHYHQVRDSWIGLRTPDGR